MDDPDITLPSSEASQEIEDLNKMAIEAALKCQWEEAVTINNRIIRTEPQDISTLNRLGRALIELGKYQQAKKIYQQVLEIDPYNVIAQRNFKKASSFKKNGPQTSHISNTISPALFIEEPGVTQVINLVKVAEPQKILTLSPGVIVKLMPKNRGIYICDTDNTYVGALPDDMSFLLLKLIKGGNKYEAFIKSVKQNGVTILVREIFRAKKFKNQPSFIGNSTSATYSSKHIVMMLDDTNPEENSEEREEIS